MDKCEKCNNKIDPKEIYTDWFYCKPCGKEWTYRRDRLNPEDTYVPLNDYEGNEKPWKKCWLGICDSQNCDNK